MAFDWGAVTGGASVAIVYLGKVLADRYRPRNGNGKSGEKDPAYWEGKFREITEDVLVNHRENMLAEVGMMKERMKEMLENQKEIRELLVRIETQLE